MNFLCQNSLKIKEDKFHHLSKDMVLHSKYFFTDLLEESSCISSKKCTQWAKIRKKFQSRKSGHSGVS